LAFGETSNQEIDMQRLMMCVGVLVASIGLMGCGGGDDGGSSASTGGGSTAAPAKAVEPGAESPEAAMTKLGQAVKDDDVASLASMLPVEKEGDAETNKKLASMLLQMKQVPLLLEKANEKFGADKVGEALGFGGMMLGGMAPPDFEKIAAEGEKTVEGDSASFSLTKQDGPMKSEQKIDLKKIGDRWFAAIDGPPGGQDMDKAIEGVNAMVTGFESAVNDSENIEGFKTKFGEVMKKMMEMSKPAGAPSGAPEIPSSIPAVGLPTPGGVFLRLGRPREPHRRGERIDE